MCAKFGNDLFNISKVIGRKTKWPRLFFGLPGRSIGPMSSNRLYTFDNLLMDRQCLSKLYVAVNLYVCSPVFLSSLSVCVVSRVQYRFAETRFAETDSPKR